jgi:23S rRNA (guanine745-N1)-methyltransferase
MMINSVLSCPLCQQPLVEHPQLMRCANNHCFDRAKQGYWNLLAVQQKKSKDPGDNPEMVEARRQFLDLDCYLPLAQAIQEKIALNLSSSNSQILDMGCGEGYYTDKWQQAFSSHHFIGLDISKHAIKAATKRNKAITWIVATGAKMPIAKQSLDLMTVVFSRLMPQPFADVLKRDASLVLVWPTTQHLLQLKQAMYTDIKESVYDPAAELDSLFALSSQELLTFELNIANEQQLSALLKMTPHGQRINDQTRLQLQQELPMNVSFSVNIGCFKKR